jgi:hypothetical protein
VGRLVACYGDSHKGRANKRQYSAAGSNASISYDLSAFAVLSIPLRFMLLKGQSLDDKKLAQRGTTTGEKS